MPKSLIDTSIYLDIRRAGKNKEASWAQNTVRHLIAYHKDHPRLTISVFTVYEILDGLNRGPVPGAARDFMANTLPDFEVIYPDPEIIAIGAEINAALTQAGITIGVVDTLIAATAIVQKMPLVNANTKHFARVRDAGFPIILENWRNA